MAPEVHYRSGMSDNITVHVTTRVESPSPTSTDVEGGVDYQAEIRLVDEAGQAHRWSGQVTYAPDHEAGRLRPVGDSRDCWISRELLAALETPWVAAHDDLVRRIVRSLGGGPSVESYEVVL